MAMAAHSRLGCAPNRQAEGSAPVLKKRSVSLKGHATSMALEPEFWAALEACAAAEGVSLAALLIRIDEGRGESPLASAARVAALGWAERR